MAPSLSKLAPGGKLGALGKLITEKMSTLNTQEVLILAAIGGSSAALYKGNMLWYMQSWVNQNLPPISDHNLWNFLLRKTSLP